MGLFSSQISTRNMVPLCRQMATSDAAGLPIIRTLELVGSQQKDKKIRDVLTQINQDIRNGSTLTDAARRQSKFLPRFFIELLATGERGGRLDLMLRELADYYEDRQAIQRKMISSLVWPMFELAAAWFLGTFAFRILGGVMDLFKAGGGQAFDFGRFFADYVVFQAKAMGVVAIVFVVCVILSRLGLFKWIWGFFATHIWPMSSITRGFGLARFFRSLSLLVGAGIDLVKSVESAAAVVVNPYIERDLLQAVPGIRRGDTLYEAFAPSRYIPRMNKEMILVGETSGELETSLRKAAEYNLEQASHASQRLITVLTVSIILLTGLVIGYVVISFYARLYGGLYNELGI